MRLPLLAVVCSCLLALLPPAHAVVVAQPASRSNPKREVLTNSSIIKLARSGLSDAALIERIRRSPRRFDTSVKALAKLRKARISESVIREMQAAPASSAVTASPSFGGATSPCLPLSSTAREPSGQRFEAFPPSRVYQQIAADEAATHRLPPLVEPLGQTRSGQSKEMRVGTVRAIVPPLNLTASARCFDLGTAGVDEVMAVVSTGARQIRLHFTGVSMASGARLFVSSLKNPSEVYGPYEGNGPGVDGSFWTPPIEGDAALIEYYRPHPASIDKNAPAPFQVTEVSHINGPFSTR